MALAPHVKISARSFPIVYTVGSTPDASFDFQGVYWEAADILVYQDGVLVDAGAYTVVGLYEQDGLDVSGAYGGGTVTLTTPVSNCEITIDRQVQLTRLTDFSSSAPLSIASLNSDLDKTVARDQDLEARVEVLERGGGGGGGGGTASWSTLTGKPASVTALAATSGSANKLPYFTSSSAMALADLSAYSRTLLALSSKADWQTALDIGGGGGGGGSAPPPLSFFGTIDDGGVATTANDAAITAAEASTYDRVWLPEGVYATTKTKSALTKSYTGPGIFLLSGGVALPGAFSQITTAPTLWPVQGATGWFRGDQKFAEGEYKIIGPGTRQRTDARYFESAFIPHHNWLDIYDGGSGVLCRLAVTASTASNQVTVDSVASGDILGKTIAFAATPDGAPIETRTVTAVAGNVLTLSANPGANHPAGTIVYTSRRTWGGHTYVRVNHYADGDGYGHIARINMYGTAKGGQTHVFETGTGGQYGGDINFQAGSSGRYATGWESYYADQGNDVAVIAQVDTFVRDNETGARGAMWLGTLFKSEGSKPADAAHVVKGKWRVGLDTTGADLTNFATAGDNKNVAINMALGQKIYLNSSQSTGGRTGSTAYGNFMGNVLGDMVFEGGNDISGDYIQWEFKRSSPNNGRIRLRPTSFNVNVQANFSAAVNVGTDVYLGALGKVEFGFASGNYLLMVGTDLYFHKAAGTFHLIV